MVNKGDFMTRHVFLWCNAIVFLAFPGCGPRIARVPVSGVVTLDGKPVVVAAVTFVPRGPGQPGMAVTDAAGRFMLHELGMHAGIRQGEYDVVILKADGPPVPAVEPIEASEIADPRTFNTLDPQPSDQRSPKYIVPERYSSSKTSGLRATVAGPTTDLVFALTTKPLKQP